MPLKPLVADVMVGRDVTQSVVLASHPDERTDADGNPSLTRRTIAMSFDGRRLTNATALSFPLDRGWSSLNGAGYCTPIRGRLVHTYLDGAWRSEPFSEADEDVLRIWGLSGKTPKDDIVVISTDGALFIRRKGKWSRHEPPSPAQQIFGVHGRSERELYVCSDGGLLLWSGDGLQELEDGPDDVVKAILVHRDEIYAGDDYLLHWAKAFGWQRWKPTVPDPTALLAIDDTIIVGTFEKGVLERRNGAFVRATPEFMCLALQQVGSGVFAAGDDQSYVRVAGRWQQLAMPKCGTGQLPREDR